MYLFKAVTFCLFWNTYDALQVLDLVGFLWVFSFLDTVGSGDVSSEDQLYNKLMLPW